MFQPMVLTRSIAGPVFQRAGHRVTSIVIDRTRSKSNRGAGWIVDAVGSERADEIFGHKKTERCRGQRSELLVDSRGFSDPDCHDDRKRSIRSFPSNPSVVE